MPSALSQIADIHKSKGCQIVQPAFDELDDFVGAAEEQYLGSTGGARRPATTRQLAELEAAEREAAQESQSKRVVVRRMRMSRLAKKGKDALADDSDRSSFDGGDDEERSELDAAADEGDERGTRRRLASEEAQEGEKTQGEDGAEEDADRMVPAAPPILSPSGTRR